MGNRMEYPGCRRLGANTPDGADQIRKRVGATTVYTGIGSSPRVAPFIVGFID